MCDRTNGNSAILCPSIIFRPKLIIVSPALWSPQTVWRARQPGVSGQYFYPCQHFVYLHNMLRKQCHLLCGLSEKEKKNFWKHQFSNLSISKPLWGTCSNRLWWSVPSIFWSVGVQWGQRMYTILQRSPQIFLMSMGKGPLLENHCSASTKMRGNIFSSFTSFLFSSYKCTNIPDVPFGLSLTP